jgi:hypothetical protein
VRESLAAEVLSRVPIAENETVLIADPDGLVRSTAVLGRLASGGIESVIWDESLESRLAWEGLGGDTHALIVDRVQKAEVLPVDVVASVQRRIAISFDDLFHALDRHVLGQLDWTDCEAALAIDQDLPDRRLDRAETASQLLRRIYQLDPDGMRDGPRLIEGLLRLHRRARPAPISQNLTEHFGAAVGTPIPGLSTAEAIHDRGTFIAWLQDAWERIVKGEDPELRAMLLTDGPRQLLDDYFEDGLLQSIGGPNAGEALPFGVDVDPDAERRARIGSGIQGLTAILDEGSLDYDGWRTVAEELAGVIAAQAADATAATGEVDALRLRVNQAFVPWLVDHYHELSTLPSINVPAMVHRAARTMDVQRGDKRVALVVVDGLSIALWRTILPMIRQADWRISESSSFAWLPTITSISRQAIFAGRPPIAFADSIGTTAKEAMLWRGWWTENAKLPEHEVGYVGLHLRNEAPDGPAANLEFAGQIGRRILGVVVEDIDHEMHGERLGEGTFHAAIRAWVGQGHLQGLLNALLDEGYRIYLTSDHGFNEVEAIGVSQAGVPADKHGRFEVYTDELLLDQAVGKSTVGGRLRWTGHGLPPGYLVYFSPLLGVLKPKGDRLLSHGGPTIEEVIVPWVTIER